MFVILDTNIYLSDIRMEGINFRNLFSLLKKTDSTLVLTRMVREEVVASYERQLRAASKKVAGAWTDYRRLQLNPHDFYEPNYKSEARDLRKRLKIGNKDIRCTVLDTMDGVDVTEVCLRGIHRRRPADDNGEELRDVILWLFAISYARKQLQPLSFISADKAFWDCDKPADQILMDIQQSTADISIYKSLDDFITSKSPQPSPVTSQTQSNLLGQTQLRELLLSAIQRKSREQSLNRFAYSLSGAEFEVKEAKFLDGASYQIDDEVFSSRLDMTFILSPPRKNVHIRLRVCS